MSHSLSESTKKKYARARELSRQGDARGVVLIMEEIVEENPDHGIFRSVLGNALWDIGELDRAENELKISVEFAPKSETNSLVYFHLLLERDKWDEAIQEARRFLSISDSKKYRELVAALHREICESSDKADKKDKRDKGRDEGDATH